MPEPRGGARLPHQILAPPGVASTPNISGTVFFYYFQFFAQVAPPKHILKRILDESQNADENGLKWMNFGDKNVFLVQILPKIGQR